MKFFKDNPIRNVLFAIGLILFLAISFKLSGDLTDEHTNVSQSDSVLNEISTTKSSKAEPTSVPNSQ